MTIKCTEGSSGSLVRLQVQCFYPEEAENIWNQQLDLLRLWQPVCIFLVQHVKLKKIGKATWDKCFDLTVPYYSDEILQVLSFSLLTFARSNTFCCTWDWSRSCTCSAIHWQSKLLILTVSKYCLYSIQKYINHLVNINSFLFRSDKGYVNLKIFFNSQKLFWKDLEI